MEVVEICPHCDFENAYRDVSDEMDTQMVAKCASCHRSIVLCDKCAALHPDLDERPCDKCSYCDLANFMNYLGGFNALEEFLGSLNPPLVDMTTGLPEGETATLEHYLSDDLGDDVQWDVKYWDIYRLVKECFLNGESSEEDCRDFVSEILAKNAE